MLLIGNDYGTEVSIGRYDALNGLLLQGNGKGGFKPLSIMQSGVCLPGNGKGLVKLAFANGKTLLSGSQNAGPVKVFEEKRAARIVRLLPDDQYALLTFRDGSKQKQECYYGASFLWQPARFISLSALLTSVEIVNGKGQQREVKL